MYMRWNCSWSNINYYYYFCYYYFVFGLNVIDKHSISFHIDAPYLFIIININDLCFLSCSHFKIKSNNITLVFFRLMGVIASSLDTKKKTYLFFLCVFFSFFYWYNGKQQHQVYYLMQMTAFDVNNHQKLK